MNYAFTEINFGDEGRVITALPLGYLHSVDIWLSGKKSGISGFPIQIKNHLGKVLQKLNLHLKTNRLNQASWGWNR
jgi:hypothetical protein